MYTYEEAMKLVFDEEVASGKDKRPFKKLPSLVVYAPVPAAIFLHLLNKCDSLEIVSAPAV